MNKALTAIILCLAVSAAFAEPRRVALVVQNKTSNIRSLPLPAFAETLTANLSGDALSVVNAGTALGYGQNRTAKELGQLFGVDGIVTASILEFSGYDIGTPPVAYTLKVRLALNLSDASTEATICGIADVKLSKNYTVAQFNANSSSLYEDLLHSAAEKCSSEFLAKFASCNWSHSQAQTAHVNFTCNIQGADVKIDGVSRGTVPAMVEVPVGVHSLLVEYPFCVPYSAKAFFTEGQTYNIVLQLDATGRERFKSETLFAETVERIRKTGETDDYVRRTLAEGTAQYWKNSGVKIEKGEVKDLKLDPPGGSDKLAPVAPTVDQLMEKARGL